MSFHNAPHDAANDPCAARWPIRFLVAWLLAVAATSTDAATTDFKSPRALRPFPQGGSFGITGDIPSDVTREQLNATVVACYRDWKKKYLAPSVRFPGDYKIKYDAGGRTVSEAMGYGMIITAYMAGFDPLAKEIFEGLNDFRKRFPSDLTPGLMCWRISRGEANRRDDCATDGDLDMAYALLLAHEQWGDPRFLEEAKTLIRTIASRLVRQDGSLRLGDWNEENGQTRLSDFMPTHFRAFQAATGDELWTRAEARGYAILRELQARYAPETGLLPDFATLDGTQWRPAKAGFLEGPYDGDFNYNSCRVPWRLGWAAGYLGDPRASAILNPFMSWVTSRHASPGEFRDGYRLSGKNLPDTEGGSACFFSPTGVAAMSTKHRPWLEKTFSEASRSRNNYYDDTVNLLCLLVMTGNAWIPDSRTAPMPTF